MASVRFGVLVLPNEPWPDLAARWRRLDEAGVDTIWSCDHFTNPHRPGQPWFEGWSGLAGLATATSRARVGLLVGAVVSRHPALYARQALTVDHITDGRLELGLGAGGAPTDQGMWGAPDWSAGERAGRFAEYVELVDRLTTAREEPVDFAGRWYSVAGALMAPGFVQSPRPPFTLAAHGRQTMAVAARFAETWNTYGPTFEDGVRQSGDLDEACEAIGRDPDEIRRSVLLGVMPGLSWTSAGEFVDRVGQWREAGFSEFVFYDPPYARAGAPVASPEVNDEVLSLLETLR